MNVQGVQKFVVASLGVGILYAGIALEVIGNADFTTVEGVVGAAVALATALGVYGVRNTPA